MANIIGHIVVSGNVRRCLDAETTVWTLDTPQPPSVEMRPPWRLRAKRIADVKQGDLVWTHHKRWRRVTEVIYQGAQPLMTLETSGGETHRVSSQHMLYVETFRRSRKWMPAGEVQRANRAYPGIYKLVCAPISTSSTAPQTIDIVRFDESRDGLVPQTYDLTVEEDESFVIGVGDCLVVHNSAQIAVGAFTQGGGYGGGDRTDVIAGARRFARRQGLSGCEALGCRRRAALLALQLEQLGLGVSHSLARRHFLGASRSLARPPFAVQ